MGKRKKGKGSKGGDKILLEDAADSDPELGRLGVGAGLEDDMDQDEAAEDQIIMSDVREMSKSARNKYGEAGTVFGIDHGDDDDDDEDSDFEGGKRGESKEDAIGSESWGAKKKYFYGGNPNETYHNKRADDKLDDDEEDEAELEARESAKLQIKQLELLDEEDFLDAFTVSEQSSKRKKGKKAKDDHAGKTTVKLDVSKLSKREKTKLFEQESPEFDGIVADFERKMNEARAELVPVVELIDAGRIPEGPAADYVKAKLSVILSYCSNVACYLMFKTRRTPLRFHPVTARLVQYKQLLDEMAASPVDSAVMEQVGKIAAQLREGKTAEELVKRARKRAKAQAAAKQESAPKRLRLLSKKKSESGKMEQAMTGDERMAIEMYEAAHGKRKRKVLAEDSSDSEAETEAAPKAAEGDDVGAEDGEDESRRSITFQIQKNKGLTPKRPKMQRNPRVKHRFKFERAKKRRKGAVREARTETKRYGGEASGINARVRKGVKLTGSNG